MEGWNRPSDKAVEFAFRLSPDVIAVHLSAIAGPEVDEHEQNLRQLWAEDVERPAQAAKMRAPKLVYIHSPYRRFVEPTVEFVRDILDQHPVRIVAVLIPDVVERRWWENLLHRHRAQALRMALLRERDPRLVVIDVPWYLEPRLGSPGNQDSS